LNVAIYKWKGITVVISDREYIRNCVRPTFGEHGRFTDWIIYQVGKYF
jgi:hypothetical protein